MRRTIKGHLIQAIIGILLSVGIFLSSALIFNNSVPVLGLVGVVLSLTSGFDLIYYGAKRIGQIYNYKKKLKEEQQYIKTYKKDKSTELQYAELGDKLTTLTTTKAVCTSRNQNIKNATVSSRQDDELIR